MRGLHLADDHAAGGALKQALMVSGSVAEVAWTRGQDTVADLVREAQLKGEGVRC